MSFQGFGGVSKCGNQEHKLIVAKGDAHGVLFVYLPVGLTCCLPDAFLFYGRHDDGCLN